jgi:predicted GNAT superfamily acetyltransferase
VIGNADAFLRAFDQTANYDSPNYVWFREAGWSLAADAHDRIMIGIRTELPNTDPMQVGRQTW